MPIRVGVDIGGTFTDLMLVDTTSGQIAVEKVLTTPQAPEQGVLVGVQRILHSAGIGPAAVDNITHGTTLVTNALIERKGARSALVTTEGFRDVAEIGREGRYDLNDLSLELPEPLIPRHLRFEVSERILPSSAVHMALDEASLDAVIETLRARKIESVAISFLNSYSNDLHERLAVARLTALLPDVFVSASSEVSPEIREYERTSTACANAYVQPIVARYIERLIHGFHDAGIRAPLFVMLSSGGLATPEVATRYPIRILESGPAAGAILAAYIGGLEGIRDLLSFDMGGTTAKACVIDGGRPRTASQMEVARVWRFKKGSGLPVNAPVIDMIEIGAGGGSIARPGRLGGIEVGPDSAGADPGPAAYGRGGTSPTVTDADVVLGYVDPRYFLGGTMSLDVERAREAIGSVADPLGLGVEAAAWWVHRVVAENMAGAARVHAAERAVDLRSLPLFAFGGAGPVHAMSVARLLGSPSVVVPTSAGVGSALGFLVAPIGFEMSQSRPAALEDISLDQVQRDVADMECRARKLVAAAGVKAEDVRIAYRVTARYAGQGFEIEVDLPEPARWSADLIAERFRARYLALNQILVEGVRIEVATWRVVASADTHPLEGYTTEPLEGPYLKGMREIFRQDTESMSPAPVYDRYRLHRGWTERGPMLIEERECTIVVPLPATVSVTPRGSIVIDGF